MVQRVVRGTQHATWLRMSGLESNPCISFPSCNRTSTDLDRVVVAVDKQVRAGHEDRGIGSDLEGNARIFSVGRYRVEARVSNDSAKLKSVMVIADTGTVPSLLAAPI